MTDRHTAQEVSMAEIKLSLPTLNGGAAVDLFDYELQRVLADIGDANTPAGKGRKITLTVTVTPNENRGVGALEIQCKATLAGTSPNKQPVYFGLQGDKVVASQTTGRQGGLFDTPDETPNITEMEER